MGYSFQILKASVLNEAQTGSIVVRQDVHAIFRLLVHKIIGYILMQILMTCEATNIFVRHFE
jgi:hypothetical protein